LASPGLRGGIVLFCVRVLHGRGSARTLCSMDLTSGLMN
jgi:hypothetical protein